MPGSHLFNLGLYQKKFLSTSKVSGGAINIGCTKGRGSSTRMLNYCNEHSANPSGCINQFITVTGSGSNSVTAVPGAPTITSIVPGFGSLSVNFVAPNNGGNAIIDYEYSTDGGISYQSYGSTNNPIVIDNLTPNQSYTIYIRAVNAIGTGPTSNASSGTAGNIGPLGNGFSFTVRDIIPYGPNYIYVGGNFTSNNSGTVIFNRLAIWNKVNETWSQNINSDGGIGIEGPVYDIIQIPNTNDLYMVGYFYNAGSTSLKSIGIFNTNNNQWSSLGSSGSGAGVEDNFNNPGAACLAYNANNGYVYFGGQFTRTSLSLQLNHIAYIDTNDTSQNKAINPITVTGSTGLNSYVSCLTVNAGIVYAGGNFTGNGSVTLNRIAAYNPSSNSWSQLGSSGLNNNVFDIVVNTNNTNLLYVGGSFTNTNSLDTPMQYIGIYNISLNDWYALNPLYPNDGPNGTVYTIAIASNGDIYVGGSFSVLYINGTSYPCNNIAKFTPSTYTWSVIPGPTSEVRKIYIDTDGIIYVGGEFSGVLDGSNIIYANYIYRYLP